MVFIKGRPIGLDLDDFLCVRGVRPDSQGYTNSVRPFEAITELNGQPLGSVPELRQAMGRIPNGAEMQVTLTAPYTKALTRGVPFGLSLTETMVVQSIQPQSQGQMRGVLANSRLVAVDGVGVTFAELPGALGPKPSGSEIDFTFVPPPFEAPNAEPVAIQANAVGTQQSAHAASAYNQAPAPLAQPARWSSSSQPAAPPPPPQRPSVPVRR